LDIEHSVEQTKTSLPVNRTRIVTTIIVSLLLVFLR